MHKLWSKAQFLILLWIPAKVLTQLKAAKLTISVNFPMRINFLQWMLSICKRKQYETKCKRFVCVSKVKATFKLKALWRAPDLQISTTCTSSAALPALKWKSICDDMLNCSSQDTFKFEVNLTTARVSPILVASSLPVSCTGGVSCTFNI